MCAQLWLAISCPCSTTAAHSLGQLSMVKPGVNHVVADAARFQERQDPARGQCAELAARQRRRRGHAAGDEARLGVEIEGQADDVARHGRALGMLDGQGERRSIDPAVASAKRKTAARWASFSPCILGDLRAEPSSHRFRARLRPLHRRLGNRLQLDGEAQGEVPRLGSGTSGAPRSTGLRRRAAAAGPRRRLPRASPSSRSSGATRARWRWPASRSTSRRPRWCACSDPRAAARPRCCASPPASSGRRAGASSSTTRRWRARRASSPRRSATSA